MEALTSNNSRRLFETRATKELKAWVKVTCQFAGETLS